MIKFNRNNQSFSEILFLHSQNSYSLTQFLQATIDFCCLPNFLRKMQFFLLLFFLSPCFKCCPNYTWFLWNFWLLYFCWRPPSHEVTLWSHVVDFPPGLTQTSSVLLFSLWPGKTSAEVPSFCILAEAILMVTGILTSFMEIPMDIVQLYSRHQRSRCPS